MADEFEVPELNPRIKSMKIGTRQLRTIKVYPFSAGQEIEVVELVGVMINAFGDAQREGDLEDLQILELFAGRIKEKMEVIIKFVTDPDDNVGLGDFDNTQLAEFIEYLFEVNFGESVKKFRTVWDKAKTLFPSPNLSQKSSGEPATA